MKTVLAFETSSPILSVALGGPSGRVSEVRSSVSLPPAGTASLQHSENLVPLIDRLLKRERLALKQIDAFAIDRGPGSFTGLRIGFSLLKGFLAVQKKPCYGALSLDMIAAKVPEGSRLGVLVDARRETICSRFYRIQKGEWVAERRPELLSLSEVISRMSKGIVLTGDALNRYRQPLEHKFGNQIRFLSKENSFPSARTLVRWFQTKDSRLTPLKDRRDFVPLYFRASEAEEKRREKQKHGA